MANFNLSLKDMSFEVIIQELNRFTSVFLTTEDETLKKYCDFLQRFYTQDLFDELANRQELKEEHLPFLFNNYLRDIDVGSLLACTDKENIIEKVVPISQYLTGLSCDYEYKRKECQTTTLKAVLPHFINVTKLSIPFICDDEMIRIITSSCPLLTDLDISCSYKVTNLGYQMLCSGLSSTSQAPCSLTTLNLYETDVSNEVVGNILKSIPTLQVLIFEDVPAVLYSLHKRDFDNNVSSDSAKGLLRYFKKKKKNKVSSKVKQYNLNNLAFYFWHRFSVRKYLEVCVELCPYIKILNICTKESEDLQLCCRFTELKCIIVDANYLREEYPIDLNSFLKIRGRNLTKLDARICSLSVSTMIQSCPNLVSVLLGGCHYIQPDKNIVNKLNSVQNLEFSLRKVPFADSHTEESLEMLLRASPGLESLKLYDWNRNSEIWHMLTNSFATCSLKHLLIVRSNVDIDSLEQMVLSCCSLQSLSLFKCEKISANDVERLNRRKSFDRKVKIRLY